MNGWTRTGRARVATLTGLLAITVVGAATLVPGPAAGSPAGSSVRPPGPERTAAVVREHPAALHLGPGQDLTATATVVDPDGTAHVRLARTYRGLPVLGGDTVVHQGPGGDWRGRSQTLTEAPAMDVSPTVGPGQAGAAARGGSPAARSVVRDEVTSSRLVVDAIAGRPRLAYEVITVGTQADGTPSRLASYVDATTGRVLRTEQQIETVNGSGRSLYAGTVPLRLVRSASTYRLKDPTRGGSSTTDLHNRQDSVTCEVFGRGCQLGDVFTSPDPVFGTGTTGSRESAAVDAHYGTGVTWDYYRQVHGRTGILGDGRGSVSRVHYGTKYANAFWDGKRMSYGDGDGLRYGPLTSLDVAGHEMTHGVTESTANLWYGGEAGGLNESTSDILGTAVEFYAANAQDRGDYLIGEEFDHQHQGFRRMDRPSRDGGSVDCWSRGVGNLDVHQSSGVGNHFFFLLAEGSGTSTRNGVRYSSPTCYGSTVSGIGLDRGARIWYRALTVYMTSDIDYHGARTATLQAARDLFGGSSQPYRAVDAAWRAVNVT